MSVSMCDFLVIGGGVVGVCIAWELRRRHPDADVVLIEKEHACGQHASGRNSGVLHAGFYYSSDSLKARFCREGNRFLTEFCLEHKLRINRCGKLVVAKNEAELPALRELHRRGIANDVDVRLISAEEAKKIEPRVKTCQHALWSPTTSSVDPGEVMTALVSAALEAGVSMRTSCEYWGHRGDEVITSQGRIHAGYLINAAGLYADRIAHDYDFARQKRMLPFKGLYLYSSEPPGNLHTHVYPVPDLAFPFLGVHFTVTVDGKTKIGPTATPAFWREHYHGLQNLRLDELLQVLWTEGSLMLHANFNFRGLAWEELKKYSRHYLVKQSKLLLEGIRRRHYKEWGHPGIRAQLVDMKERKLIMDFAIESDARSLHVLNAVSPAFTCSMPFAQYVCNLVDVYQGTPEAD
jgi:L-2-hydroxyglutarate oxidase